jgi:hypothetical protein
MLLSREKFREAVFARDGYKCVICGKSDKIDAHHIIERRLWADGGYYENNGATLCDDGKNGCHYKAETTFLSVEDIRIAAKIDKPIIPEDMYSDHIYDKWGNTILTDGRRSKGPLFSDASAQKAIADYNRFDVISMGEYLVGELEPVQFVEYVKYSRTYHLPWSPGITDDDRIMKDTSVFNDRRVIVTRKMDGENFNGYRSYCHARSIDGRSHYTRDWAKAFWMQRSYELPEGWRVCAENLYAVHSIEYKNLPSFLLGFSIWNEQNECLSWDETVEWFSLLDVPMVPVLYDGIWDEDKIKSLYDEKTDVETHEGYVVRLADSFQYGEFKNSVAKFVRKNHVNSDSHWFFGKNNHKLNTLETDDVSNGNPKDMREEDLKFFGLDK